MRGAVLLLLLAAAAEEHKEHCEELAFAYFAVGPRTLAKARRSARSAKAAHPQAHTVLITDAKGASHVKKEATKCDGHGIVFDYVDVLGEAENATSFSNMPEFVAFRTYQKDGKKLVSKHKPWTTVGDANNKAVADLRAAKIRSLTEALKRAPTYGALVFLDADTIVCRSLVKYACGMGSADVAFVPVPPARWHAGGQLRLSYDVDLQTPEANTGALFLRRTPKALSLLKHWSRTYKELRRADPPQLMDQVAFRAALHISRAAWHAIDDAANCRGRDPATRAHAALACDGFDHEDTFVATSTSTDDPETSPRAVAAALSVEKRLRGGRHCDVLHSHETSDFRRLDTLTGRKTCAWVSLPFSVDDASIHERVARQAFDDCEEWVAAPPRNHGLDYALDLRYVAVVRDASSRSKAEYDACCARGDSSHWCGGICVENEKRHDFVTRRGDAQLAVLAPGEPCVAAQRPPPSRADARVVLDLVRAGRLLLYKAAEDGPAGEGLDARLVHAATGLGD